MKKRRWTVAAVAVMLLFTGCSFGTLKEQKTGAIVMDKNPKHPLKKKKVHQKMNVADHSVEEQAAFGKHKKHTYE